MTIFPEVPFLDGKGELATPTVLAQLDARTKATMRTDLPALADELGIGSTAETLVTTSSFEVTEAGDFLADVATVLTLPDASQVTLMAGDAAVVRYFAGQWRAFTGSNAPVVRDEVAPTAGTLTVATGPTTATLTVSGALDDTALHALPYAYSKDSGATWTAWTDAATHRYTGLAESTSYGFRHKVRDAAGNERLGTTVTKSTTKTPVFAVVGKDTFTAADGTALAGRTTEVGGFTTTGSGTITGNRMSQGQVTSAIRVEYPAPTATTKQPTRASVDYNVGTYQGSQVKLGIWTNSAGTNATSITIDNTGKVAFSPYSVPSWAVAWEGGAAPTVAMSGTMSIEVDPAAGSGVVTINGAKVATLSGPTTHIAGGATATLTREGWMDDLTVEVAS